MKISSPSPKVLQVIIAVVFVVVMTISFNNYQNNKPTQNTSTENQRELLVSVDNNKTSGDSDGDLLQDWEEILWKTDPNNPDTDGDGTKDGVEISLQRDPNVPGPDDSMIDEVTTDRGQLPESSVQGNSFTAKAGIDIFREVLENSQNPNNPINADTIVQNLENEANSNLGSSDLYTKNDLIIQSNNSNEILRRYYDNFTAVVVNEIIKVGQLVDPSDEVLGDTMIGIYNNMHQRLSSIPVPEIMSDVHLDYINSLATSVYYYEIILDEEKDPLLSYYAIPKFRDSMNRAEQLLTQILNYLENNDIISAEDFNSIDSENE